MASNHINTTNPLGQAPTTKLDEYPVQHGSAAKNPIASTGNQEIPEESGNIDDNHQTTTGDEVSGSQQGHRIKTSTPADKIGTPQEAQTNAPADGSPVPNYPQTNGYYYYPYQPQYLGQIPYMNYYMGVNVPPLTNVGQPTTSQSPPDPSGHIPGITGSQGPVPVMNTGTDQGHSNPLPLFQMSPGLGFQNQTPIKCTFTYLHNPNSLFTLSRVVNPLYYKRWLAEFSEILRKQGLGDNLPARRNGYRKCLKDEEEEYIANIHMACVPSTSYPEWFKKSLEKNIDFIDCFLEAVAIISEETDIPTLLREISTLSLRDRESVEKFAQRTTKIFQRVERANTSGLEDLLIHQVLQALPSECSAMELVFSTQEDKSFDTLMKLLLSKQWSKKDTKRPEQNNNKHQGKQWNSNSNERKQYNNRYNNNNQYASNEESSKETVQHVSSKQASEDLRLDPTDSEY